MDSVTTALQFSFVVFHYTFIYSVFSVIGMVESVLVRLAGKPAGQLIFWIADCVLALLVEAAAYPNSQIRTTPWMLFLPAFFTVQWWRCASSVALYLLAGRTVSSKDVQGVIESVREMLQDVFVRGRQTIRSQRVYVKPTEPETVPTTENIEQVETAGSESNTNSNYESDRTPESIEINRNFLDHERHKSVDNSDAVEESNDIKHTEEFEDGRSSMETQELSESCMNNEYHVDVNDVIGHQQQSFQGNEINYVDEENKDFEGVRN